MLKRLLLILSILVFVYVTQVEAGECPQPRTTKPVPADIAALKNPKTSPDDIKAGEELYQKTAKPIACHMCHGKTGEGDGPAGKALKPAPRNFACKKTMDEISDGQLFGITKNGSPGTGMLAHAKTLTDDQIWQLIAYIRTLAK